MFVATLNMLVSGSKFLSHIGYSIASIYSGFSATTPTRLAISSRSSSSYNSWTGYFRDCNGKGEKQVGINTTWIQKKVIVHDFFY
jgi:hypothetical protein